MFFCDVTNSGQDLLGLLSVAKFVCSFVSMFTAMSVSVIMGRVSSYVRQLVEHRLNLVLEHRFVVRCKHSCTYIYFVHSIDIHMGRTVQYLPSTELLSGFHPGP